MAENKVLMVVRDIYRRCQNEHCPELIRATAEAEKLRTLLARALDHIPADTSLASESRAALD